MAVDPLGVVVGQVSELSGKESSLGKQAKSLERKLAEQEQQLQQSREAERESDKVRVEGFAWGTGLEVAFRWEFGRETGISAWRLGGFPWFSYSFHHCAKGKGWTDAIEESPSSCAGACHLAAAR